MASKKGRTNLSWKTPERILLKAVLAALHEVPGRMLIADKKAWGLAEYRALLPFARSFWPADAAWTDDREWGRALTAWADKPNEHLLTGTQLPAYAFTAMEIVCRVYGRPMDAAKFQELAHPVGVRLQIKTRDEFRALLDKYHPDVIRYNQRKASA